MSRITPGSPTGILTSALSLAATIRRAPSSSVRDRNCSWKRQPMAQLVGAEARGGACREQQAYDVQAVGCLTSQAEGSKRRSGFAAQVGSLTPWRTAVISARIATAISGGVFEPM